MSIERIRRFPLIWTGLALIVATGVLSGATEVDGGFAGWIAWPVVVLFILVVATPLERLSAEEPLPAGVLAASAAVLLACCVWNLTFPNDQFVAIYAAIPSLAGVGALSGAQAGFWGAVAWSALLAALVGGLVNWRLCVLEARRRRRAQQAT